jgi:hypothetical protein
MIAKEPAKLVRVLLIAADARRQLVFPPVQVSPAARWEPVPRSMDAVEEVTPGLHP